MGKNELVDVHAQTGNPLDSHQPPEEFPRRYMQRLSDYPYYIIYFAPLDVAFRKVQLRQLAKMLQENTEAFCQSMYKVKMFVSFLPHRTKNALRDKQRHWKS